MQKWMTYLLGLSCLIVTVDAAAFRDQDQQYIIEKAMKEKQARLAKAQASIMSSASSVVVRSGRP